MFDVLCVFTASFLGAFAAFLLSWMKEQQGIDKLDREEKLHALAYEQPVALTVENLMALRAALPPYADTVWCLGYNEYKHLATLKCGDGRYAFDAAGGKLLLLGDPIVMVQLSIPGHDASIAYVPMGIKKDANADLWGGDVSGDVVELVEEKGENV